MMTKPSTSSNGRPPRSSTPPCAVVDPRRDLELAQNSGCSAADLACALTPERAFSSGGGGHVSDAPTGEIGTGAVVLDPYPDRPFQRDEVERAVQFHFPEDAAIINRCLLPGITFVSAPRSDGRIALRLGGGARLPARVQWPVNGDRDLFFVGAVDLTVVGPMDIRVRCRHRDRCFSSTTSSVRAGDSIRRIARRGVCCMSMNGRRRVPRCAIDGLIRPMVDTWTNRSSTRRRWKMLHRRGRYR